MVMPSPKQTELSRPHLKALTTLRDNGIAVSSEVPVTVNGITYRLDCFLPDYLVALEIDGPYHLKAADKRRDEALASVGLLTIRFTAGERLAWALVDFLAGAEQTLPQRRILWKERQQ